MKRLTFLLLLLSLAVSLLSVSYLVVRLDVTERCMQVYGWEYYSIYPEPKCHAELQVATLELLESIVPNVEIPESHSY
jgi:hypothetical protein